MKVRAGFHTDIIHDIARLINSHLIDSEATTSCKVSRKQVLLNVN